MADYLDLEQIMKKTTQEDQDLADRVTFAVGVAANAIVSEADTTPNHTERVQWAARAPMDT